MHSQAQMIRSTLTSHKTNFVTQVKEILEFLNIYATATAVLPIGEVASGRVNKNYLIQETLNLLRCKDITTNTKQK